MVQRPVLVRHYALPWRVCIQQHMVGRLFWPEDLCVPCEAPQQRLQPPASRSAALTDVS